MSDRPDGRRPKRYRLPKDDDTDQSLSTETGRYRGAFSTIHERHVFLRGIGLGVALTASSDGLRATLASVFLAGYSGSESWYLAGGMALGVIGGVVARNARDCGHDTRQTAGMPAGGD